MIWKLVVLAVGFAIGISAWGSTWINTDINEGGSQEKWWKAALHFAVDKYNQESNHTYLSQVSRVIGVQNQTQDVNGVNYKFTVEMGKNTCLNGTTGQRIEGIDCVVLADLQLVQFYMCRFTVWSQPSANLTDLTSQSCDEAKQVNL